MLRRSLLVALAAVTVLLPACGDDGDAGDGGGAEVPELTGPVQEGAVQVSSIDNSFRPEQLRVKSGSEVTWTNDGRNDHNVIPEDEAYGFRVDVEQFKPGDAYSYTFTEPGVYRYYCSIHGTIDSGMIGVVEVVA